MAASDNLRSEYYMRLVLLLQQPCCEAVKLVFFQYLRNKNVAEYYLEFQQKKVKDWDISKVCRILKSAKFKLPTNVKLNIIDLVEIRNRYIHKPNLSINRVIYEDDVKVLTWIVKTLFVYANEFQDEEKRAQILMKIGHLEKCQDAVSRNIVLDCTNVTKLLNEHIESDDTLAASNNAVKDSVRDMVKKCFLYYSDEEVWKSEAERLHTSYETQRCNNKHTERDLGDLSVVDVKPKSKLYVIEASPTNRTAYATPLEGTTVKKHALTINVACADDKHTPAISGMVLLDDPTLLVLADMNNGCLKLVHIDNTVTKIDASIVLCHMPHGIAKRNENEVLVAIPESTDLFVVKVGHKELTVKGTIPVGTGCRGVAYADGMYVVSFDSPQSIILVVKEDGHVLRTFDKDEHGEKMFSNPWNIIFSFDKHRLFVSDAMKAKVTILDVSTGKVQKIINNPANMRSPRGATELESGDLLVCGYLKEAVCRISINQEDHNKVVFGKADGVVRPMCAVHCAKIGRLFVGMFENDSLIAYQY